MSTHKVEVVRLGPIEKHTNADTLGIVKIWGYTAIVRLDDFAEGDLVAYIEPDYVVPETPQFSFLKDRRIRAKRLRGTWSQGLVTKAPEGTVEGDDVMEYLGITRYEPPQHLSIGGDAEAPCAALGSVPKYDIESLRRYAHLFTSGELVVVTEKIHGANARYAWRDDRMWCGSRTQWKRHDASSIWWKALAANPWIEIFCRTHQNAILYGEVYGQVQDLKYSAKPGEVFFRVFDVLDNGRWWSYDELEDAIVERVPHLGIVPFDLGMLEEMSRRDSALAPHLAEGIVIRPRAERFSEELNGRVVLKLVSDRYLERA